MSTFTVGPLTCSSLTSTGAQSISGIVTNTNSTNSTSPSTGALVLSYGGLGVAGNVYCNSNIQTNSLGVNNGNSSTFLLGDFNQDHNGGYVLFQKNSSGSLTNNLTLGFNVNSNGLEPVLSIARQSGGASGGCVIVVPTTASSSTTTGALVVSGGMGVAGNANVGGNLTITGTFSPGSLSTGTISGTAVTASVLSVVNTATFNSNIVVTTSISCLSGFTVNGVGNISTTSTTAATNFTNGALVIAGGAGIGGNLYTGGSIASSATVSGVTASFGSSTPVAVSSSGILTANNSTSSTSTSTGSIVTPGGIGCAGYIHAGGVAAAGGFSSDLTNYFGYTVGTWTPTVTVYSYGSIYNNGTNYSITSANYTKIGNLVTLQADFTYDLPSGNPAVSLIAITGNPYIIKNGQAVAVGSYYNNMAGVTNPLYMQLSKAGSIITGGTGTQLTSTGYEIVIFAGNMVYQTPQLLGATGQRFTFTLQYLTN